MSAVVGDEVEEARQELEALPRRSQKDPLGLMPIGSMSSVEVSSQHGRRDEGEEHNTLSLPADEWEALLQRQTEVSQAVEDQEKSAIEMLNMINHLTNVIAEQEDFITSLQGERSALERRTAELSFELRNIYRERDQIQNLYEAVIQRLESVHESTEDLQTDLRRKDMILAAKDAEIAALRQKTIELERRNQPSPELAQKKKDREQRLTEIRRFLRCGKIVERPIVSPPTTTRLRTLRAARDSRLQEMRGLLEKSRLPETTSIQKPGKATSISSATEECLSEDSSVQSLISALSSV
jgi:chromosome segregation ATPase